MMVAFVFIFVSLSMTFFVLFTRGPERSTHQASVGHAPHWRQKHFVSLSYSFGRPFFTSVPSHSQRLQKDGDGFSTSTKCLLYESHSVVKQVKYDSAKGSILKALRAWHPRGPTKWQQKPVSVMSADDFRNILQALRASTTTVRCSPSKVLHEGRVALPRGTVSKRGA